jgi:Domain of unknown function (DUF4913)
MTTDPATAPAARPGDSGLAPPGESTAADDAGLIPDPPDPADRSEAPEPVYTAVEDWVIDYFLPMFRRTLGGEFRWCGHWWRHGEAISRLTALWHAWEVLRLQPGTGMATWYRDHLDHQLPVLMGARGPFCQCSETAHREPREGAAVPAPGDWWDAINDELAEAQLPGPATSPADHGSHR